MNLDEFKIKLSEMLYEVFGGTNNNAVVKRENVLELPNYDLKIYKYNGCFLVAGRGALCFENPDSIKVLWWIGEEIAKIRIYAATVSG